ncbi:TPA: Rha family transcriptional regulator [Staphylococcus aureus]|nr:Rha family transcriptional regulator [Staphylococcus aureus]
MQELQLVEQNETHYVDSREVAEMVGKEHKNLIRDIENYRSVILQSSKLSPDDYFVESTYLGANNRQTKHYLLTKKGCDIVANKMTGSKGILFTATYVDAFHKMDEYIKQQAQLNVPQTPMQALRLMFEATEETKQEIKNVKDDVIDLKENQKLDAGDYNFLTRTINQRVAHIQRLHAITNQKQRSELFRDINSEVKKMTGASSRTNVRQKHFDDVIEMIANWFPSQATLYRIKQIEMKFENEI